MTPAERARTDKELGAAVSMLGAEASAELGRAVLKHAPIHSLHEGYAVILEELDELWDEVRAWQPGGNLRAARKEAIQVAAMALRLVLDVCDAKPIADAALTGAPREPHV